VPRALAGARGAGGLPPSRPKSPALERAEKKLQEAEDADLESDDSGGMSQQLDFLMSSMRSKIQNAVSEMQAQLQEELQEEELKIYHVLGQGAFGTVYHGAPFHACMPCVHVRCARFSASRACVACMRTRPLTPAMHAGEWQGIQVAIKTVVFQSGKDQTQSSLIVSEAAIASNLFHKNVVTTYCHDVRMVPDKMLGNEEGVFKFYLLQVRAHACHACMLGVRARSASAERASDAVAHACCACACGNGRSVQEYCNGGSLRQATIQGLFSPSAERHWRTVMSLLIDIAQGMAYIHSKRICHGDLNPANVLLKVRAKRLSERPCSRIPRGWLESLLVPRIHP
jgi:serine/threonine protein kinase